MALPLVMVYPSPTDLQVLRDNIKYILPGFNRHYILTIL